MKKFLIASLAALSLNGCVVTAGYPDAHVYVAPAPVVVYPLGYYNPYRGYWDGYRWDVYYYNYGHRGYGHGHYRHY